MLNRTESLKDKHRAQYEAAKVEKEKEEKEKEKITNKKKNKHG